MAKKQLAKEVKRGRGRPPSDKSFGVYVATRISKEAHEKLVAAAARLSNGPSAATPGSIMRQAIVEWIDKNHPKA